MNFEQSEIKYYKPGDEITFTDEQMKKISDNDKFFDDMKKMKEEIEDVLSKYGLAIKNMLINGDQKMTYDRGFISIRSKEEND